MQDLISNSEPLEQPKNERIYSTINVRSELTQLLREFRNDINDDFKITDEAINKIKADIARLDSNINIICNHIKQLKRDIEKIERRLNKRLMETEEQLNMRLMETDHRLSKHLTDTDRRLGERLRVMESKFEWLCNSHLHVKIS